MQVERYFHQTLLTNMEILMRVAREDHWIFLQMASLSRSDAKMEPTE